MAKFSVIDDDDEEGPVIYKRRRFSQRFRSWIVAEEEEEEDLIPIVDLVSQDESDTICPVFNNNGNRRRRQLHVAIIDPDLLECPICLDQLFTPVFQVLIIYGGGMTSLCQCILEYYITITLHYSFR